MAEDEKPDALLEEAMDWLLRLQDAPRDSRPAQQLKVWLSQSPAHEHAWNKARRAWRLLGKVPPVYEHLWKDQAPSLPPARQSLRGSRTHGPASPSQRRLGGWVTGAASAAAIGIFLLFAAPSIMVRMEADHVTTAGENRTITLADGTVVTLGADSAIASDLDGRERRVALLSGEAFFEVTHDTSRPFVVEAGGVGVTVLGTAFNVQLTTDAATVELERGSVRVAYDNENAVLAPGEMVAVDRRTGAMARSAIAREDIAAWRSGHIFVNDATIGSVVEQLQRYHSAWIKVPDGKLAAQRVTGLYDLRDPDRALRAIVQPYGGNVREISPYLRVLSRF